MPEDWAAEDQPVVCLPFEKTKPLKLMSGDRVMSYTGHLVDGKVQNFITSH